MASASFRESLNSLGWSRRDPDIPVRTSSTTPILQKLQSYNPFNSGSVQLPTDENPGAPLPRASRREEDEAWFALSRWDRILMFSGLNLAALALIIVVFVLWPVMIARPSKFALLWTMASVLFLASWAVMMGPMAYVQHLISGPRLPFTAAYFGSIGFTLYFALGPRWAILTILSAMVQLVCMVWYFVSYFPLGAQGLRFAGSYASTRVASWMGS